MMTSKMQQFEGYSIGAGFGSSAPDLVNIVIGRGTSARRLPPIFSRDMKVRLFDSAGVPIPCTTAEPDSKPFTEVSMSGGSTANGFFKVARAGAVPAKVEVTLWNETRTIELSEKKD
jgi:hypothetical protein